MERPGVLRWLGYAVGVRLPERYNDWARHILRGQLTDHLAFYGLPGYAYLLAFLYRIFGYNPFVPALFQAVLDATIGVFIYQLSLRAFSAPESVRPNPESAAIARS